MHHPADATCLPFPVHMKRWAVVSFLATEEELRAAFGEPHFVEVEVIEDNWAWVLPNGQRLRVVLEVPYDYVIVYCDPPVPHVAVTVLGLSAHVDGLKIFPEPVLMGGSAGDA
jgi:hypothetical protein